MPKTCIYFIMLCKRHLNIVLCMWGSVWWNYCAFLSLNVGVGLKVHYMKNILPDWDLLPKGWLSAVAAFFFFFVICFLNKDDPVFIYDLVKLGTAFCLPLCLYKSLLTVIMVLLLLHYIQWNIWNLYFTLTLMLLSIHLFITEAYCCHTRRRKMY